MRMHSDYGRLEKATDIGLMQPIFRQELERLGRTVVTPSQFFIPRVFPRGEGTFAIQYQMLEKRQGSTTPQPLTLFGLLSGPASSEPIHGAMDSDKGFVLKDLRLAVPLFPYDPKLSRLPDVYTTGRDLPILRDWLASIGVNDEAPEIIACDLLGYRIERRCVLRYTLGGPALKRMPTGAHQIVLKLFRSRKAISAAGDIIWLKNKGFAPDVSDRLTVPDVYYIDLHRGACLMESAPGDSIHNLIGKETFKKGCQAAALVLKKLHSTKATHLAHYAPQDELQSLAKTIARTARIFPETERAGRQTFDALQSTTVCLDDHQIPCCIHRDYYDKQVLYSEARTTLLDCDGLALGDPAQDVGNFSAHLFLRRLQHPDCKESIQRGLSAFEDTYDNNSHAFAGRVRWWRATTLARLAGLYSLRPRWRHLTPELLQAAGSLVMDNDTEVMEKK